MQQNSETSGRASRLPGQATLGSNRSAPFGYLPRALGEVLLIVIGVLIALFVDDWRRGIEDRQREVSLLSAVMLDLEADSLVIALEVERLPETLEALRVLRSLNPDDLPPRDSLDRIVALTMRYVPNRWHTTAFNALEQSGELRLIRDPGLLRELSVYYKDYLGNAIEQTSVQRAIHDRWIFEVWGEYGVVTTGRSVEETISRHSDETLIADPSGIAAWLRSGSGMASLHEIGLIRVIQEFQEVESVRSALRNRIATYLGS